MNSLPFNGNGQINMSSIFGQKIYEICKHPSVNSIFEVGTWNGQGSTVCIMNAIYDKNDAVLYSIESDKIQFSKSAEFWSQYNDSKLKLLYGLLHREPLPDLMLDHNSSEYIHHYAPEGNMIKDMTIPLINLEFINNLDCILLDGGEYTTERDFEVLSKYNPKVIILDDSNVYKCKSIRENYLNNSEYKIFYDDLNDRNGATIFIHKDL